MADVQVLSTPGCAGCAKTKRLLAKVLAEFPGVDWEEVDLIDQPELAERYGIMSVPAVVLDGKLEFTGVPKEDTLREKIKSFAERR